MDLHKTMREAVLLAARAAKAAGLCTGGTGNCSMIDRAAGIVAMTPHDSDRVAKTWREIVLMDLAGQVLDAPAGVEPTSEAAFHLAVYRARPDVSGICHTHAPYATVFAALGREILPVTTEALLYGGRCPLAPYAPPGTEALAESIVKTLGESGLAAVLERHGMIAVSPRDVDDAFRMAVHVEETAKAYYRMASLIGLEQVKAEV
ncbi:class II aldolase/adducin family protein [bacterium]|nr:class II aldolase/adducin family protein [bacterium]